jgi:hypothetical protein
MDATIIDQAAVLTRRKGDGRISIKDADLLMNLVQNVNSFTDVEKTTIDYLFQKFSWTPIAFEWFRKEMGNRQPHRKLIQMSIAELSSKRFSQEDVLTDDTKRAARKHLLESAALETQQDHDEIGLWIRLKDGMTVKVFSNFIALENEFVQLRAGCTVPVRAIEKIEI